MVHGIRDFVSEFVNPYDEAAYLHADISGDDSCQFRLAKSSLMQSLLKRLSQ